MSNAEEVIVELWNTREEVTRTDVWVATTTVVLSGYIHIVFLLYYTPTVEVEVRKEVRVTEVKTAIAVHLSKLNPCVHVQ